MASKVRESAVETMASKVRESAVGKSDNLNPETRRREVSKSMSLYANCGL
jgi:hypothetical protein